MDVVIKIFYCQKDIPGLFLGLHTCITGCTIDAQIICAKVREGDQRIVRIKEGDPNGRHVIIVDDLVQSGGTLIECQVTKPGITQISEKILNSRRWKKIPISQIVWLDWSLENTSLEKVENGN